MFQPRVSFFRTAMLERHRSMLPLCNDHIGSQMVDYFVIEKSKALYRGYFTLNNLHCYDPFRTVAEMTKTRD